jgi:hypothetical protein
MMKEVVPQMSLKRNSQRILSKVRCITSIKMVVSSETDVRTRVSFDLSRDIIGHLLNISDRVTVECMLSYS